MSTWIRQIHRWIAAAFVITVIITFIALTRPEPVEWVAYVPLFPLLVLMITGSYLFVQPYLTRWRRRGQAARET